MPNNIPISVFGGGRWLAESVPNARISWVPSTSAGGAARFRHGVAAVRQGAVAYVLLLVRWLGHSDFHAVVLACRTAGVPYRVVPGGVASAARLIRTFLSEEP